MPITNDIVTCNNCKENFAVIVIDGKLLGKYFCPECGTPYIENKGTK